MTSHRIRTALELTRELLRSSPIKPDLMPEYVALQMWPFVVPLYHGIEQALKCLLLLQTPTANPKEYGHDLKIAFDALHDDDRQHIEMHFSQHLSLHADYRPDETGITSAAAFIAHINSSGTNQEGSTTWRYLLLEGAQAIPPLHLWGMVEIWDAACCQMRRRDENGNRLDNDSCSCLAVRISDLVMRQQTGRASPYEEFTDDANEWFRRHGNIPLVAWVDLLCKVYRQAIYEIDAPPRLLPCLAEDANKLLDRLKSEPVGSDEWKLWARIEDTGGCLAWDAAKGTFRVLSTPPPTIPDLPQSETGVRLQVSDLLLGDNISIPSLASLRWTIKNRCFPTSTDIVEFSAPATYWTIDAHQVDSHSGDDISIPQRVLEDPSLLGSLRWEVVKVERIEASSSSVQERWITAIGQEAGTIRLRMRDNQKVLDRNFAASTYVQDSNDHETGQLYYFDPEDSVRSTVLDKLRSEGIRYKVRSTVWSGHGDNLDLNNPQLARYSISVLLSNCRAPAEIDASLRQVLELLETPSHHLSLVNEAGADWKVMAGRVDSPRFPLDQVGVVHRDRMRYPRSDLVEPSLPTEPPALHVVLGNWNEPTESAES